MTVVKFTFRLFEIQTFTYHVSREGDCCCFKEVWMLAGELGIIFIELFLAERIFVSFDLLFFSLF